MDVLALLIVVVIAVMARSRLRGLEARLAAVEFRLAGGAPTAAVGAAAEPRADREAASAAPTATFAPAAERPVTAGPGPAEAEPAEEQAPSPPPHDAQATSQPSIEERLGTRWVVWVGGLALALGGVFLVRYSIEQGLIGPGVRVTLGALLAAALIAAGEWTRRKEQQYDFAGLPTAHIPSILTAAGTVVAFADVYAAYALYGFLGPAPAFILLGLVALATLAAALLHGPALAALGLAASYVTPLLVAAAEPDYWSLYVYLAVVTAAVFALARMRLWRWLAVTAVVFGTLWIFAGIDDSRSGTLAPHVFHAVAGFALAAAMIVSGLLWGPAPESGRIDGISSGALTAYLFAATVLVLTHHHDAVALGAFTVLAAATVAIAWRAEAPAAAVPAAALFTLFVFADWALDTRIENLVAPGGATTGLTSEPARAYYGTHLVLGGFFAFLFGAPGYLAQGRSGRPIAPILWAAAAVFGPLAILVALYFRITGFERSLPFAALALLLAALYAVATETLSKRPSRPGMAAAEALFAVGAIASLALALTFALEKGWLTVALALMVPGIAWIGQRRPFPFLRWLAAAVVVLVLARIAWEPRIVGADVGTTPLFNWLLYGYGAPALSFWVAGYLMRKRADDLPSRVVDSAAILFTVLLAVLEIRHYVNSGNIYRPASSAIELGLQVSVGLAMTIGLERVRGRTANIVHNVGALVLAALTLVAIVFELVVVVGPRFNNTPVGGLFFNHILLGYGFPAVLAITLALIARSTRPMAYRAIAAATAVTLALFYLTLEIRRFYHGPVLGEGLTTDAEQYTYSAVWLAFGLVLLVVGHLLASKPARLAAAAVIMLTVAKVFVLDTNNLTGIWRALSLIGLGLPLVIIGYFYQRLTLSRRSAIAQPAASAPAS